MELFRSLQSLFPARDKRLVLFLLLGSVGVSLVETASLSAVMLFASVATNFDLVTTNKYFYFIYKALYFEKPSHFVLSFGVFLLFFYAVRAALNIAQVYYLNKFSQMRQHYFASLLFKRFVRLPYHVYVMQNSSSLGQTIFSYTSNITQVVSGLLSISAETLTILCVYAMLFYVNWKMTLVLTSLLSIKVFAIVKTFSGKITHAGKISQRFGLIAGKTFSETFQNYKFLKLLARDNLTINSFIDAHKTYARASATNAVWQGLPRFILETLGFFILIGVMLYVIYRYNNAQFVVPIVSLYALAFYRFLPSVNKILMGYNQIIFNKHALKPVLQYLIMEEESLGELPLAFNKTIKLSDVTFAYGMQPPIFEHVSCIIRKGERIGFVGASGAGKTTLVDIVIGLLTPQVGTIVIDDELLTNTTVRAWRRKIGYIPQHVTLFDGTVLDNVVCGREVNENEVVRCLKQAHIYDFLLTKDDVATRVGEGGIQLSGGQKQRIAIARALYGDPEILVLDEATSALDNETEAIIMDNIYDVSAHKTLLVIAHRLSTIARCDRVYRIEKGSVFEVSVASYSSGIQHSTVV